METVQIIEEEFPFIYDSKDIRIVCQQFLDASISRDQFESYIIQKNIDLKDGDIKLDKLYRSWGMGRPGMMDGAPEYAVYFREEINHILGMTFAW
jgi:hypothetical protein